MPCDIILLSGTYKALLLDLSRSGARIVLENPPKKGDGAIMRFDGNEIFCLVTWVDGARCGLQFDQPLTNDVLAKARWLSENYPSLEREACINWAKKFVMGNAA